MDLSCGLQSFCNKSHFKGSMCNGWCDSISRDHSHQWGSWQMVVQQSMRTKFLTATLWQVLCLQVSLGVPATAPGKVCGWHSLWVNGAQETEPSTRLRLSGTSLVTVFLAA